MVQIKLQLDSWLEHFEERAVIGLDTIQRTKQLYPPGTCWGPAPPGSPTADLFCPLEVGTDAVGASRWHPWAGLTTTTTEGSSSLEILVAVAAALGDGAAGVDNKKAGTGVGAVDETLPPAPLPPPDPPIGERRVRGRIHGTCHEGRVGTAPDIKVKNAEFCSIHHPYAYNTVMQYCTWLSAGADFRRESSRRTEG